MASFTMRLLVGVIRLLMLRCPHCGVGHLARWIYGFHEACNRCQYVFLGEEGDFWGGVIIGFLGGSAVGILASALLSRVEWLGQSGLVFLSALAAAGGVVLIFPFAKVAWIHFLYHTRAGYEEYGPPSQKELLRRSLRVISGNKRNGL